MSWTCQAKCDDLYGSQREAKETVFSKFFRRSLSWMKRNLILSLFVRHSTWFGATDQSSHDIVHEYLNFKASDVSIKKKRVRIWSCTLATIFFMDTTSKLLYTFRVTGESCHRKRLLILSYPWYRKYFKRVSGH